MSDIETPDAFAERLTAGCANELDRRRALFAAVQSFPYATNAANDAEQLLALGAGNCMAKAALLRDALAAVGSDARLVRWSYRLNDPFAELLPVNADVHTATQVRVRGSWRTVDATHDPGLPSPPFVVAPWDGISDTEVAYEPTSDMWIVGKDDEAISLAVQEIADGLRDHDATEYSSSFNSWLSECRAQSQAHITIGIESS